MNRRERLDQIVEHYKVRPEYVNVEDIHRYAGVMTTEWDGNCVIGGETVRGVCDDMAENVADYDHPRYPSGIYDLDSGDLITVRATVTIIPIGDVLPNPLKED